MRRGQVTETIENEGSQSEENYRRIGKEVRLGLVV